MSKLKCPKLIKIMLVGEGGQGIQTVAKLLAKGAFKNKYHASYIPNFGTEQRGGISLSFVQISCKPIISPKFETSDVFVIVSSRDIERTLRYIGPNTSVIYDNHLVTNSVLDEIKKKSHNLAGVDIFDTAVAQFTERSFNIIILGVLTSAVDPDIAPKIKNLMNKKFEKYYKKRPELKKSNEQAFDFGLKLSRRSN
jgi:2-oxoglutarate ferredoxin oxidoreductase subunit gamma